MIETNGDITDKSLQELEASFQELEEEYLKPFFLEKSSHRSPPPAQIIDERKILQNAVEERKTVTKCLSTACPCGANCERLFSASEVIEARENFRLMSWSEQHSFIIGKLQTFMRVAEQAVSARSSKLRERQKFDYFINADRPVCRTMFLFYHGESIDRLKRRQNYLLETGTLPPDHGNKGKTPKHACKLKDKNLAKIFIENFTATHGLPDPGRDLRAEKGRLKVYLPTVMNYRFVHRAYKESMELNNADSVQYQTFRRIWLEYFPNIVFSKPKSDLCITCEDNKKLINASISFGDEEYKLDCLKTAQEHLLAAKKERDFYRNSIKQSKESYLQAMKHGRFLDNIKEVMHYSWDFSQQIQFPYEDHQVGPIYFKSPRVAQLFGVCCEALPQQVNYLIDEGDFPAKGADTVISLLDHYFEHYGRKEKHALLTADNCVGQNKNNAILQYLLYRVMTGRHKSITLSFMLVGHTKFSPDGYFGLIKKKYRRSKVYTYHQLVDVINSSTNGKFNVCHTFGDANQDKNVQFRKWSVWLKKYFRELPGITGYQHFRFTATSTGKVVVKQYADTEEKTISLLKDKKLPFRGDIDSPEIFSAKGLTAKRQWYLYDAIRSHIPNAADKDATAPKPKVPRPKDKE